MFVPVQFGAHMLALYVAPYVRAYTVSGKSDDTSEEYLASSNGSSSWDLGALIGSSSSSSSASSKEEKDVGAVQELVNAEEDISKSAVDEMAM